MVLKSSFEVDTEAKKYNRQRLNGSKKHRRGAVKFAKQKQQEYGRDLSTAAARRLNTECYRTFTRWGDKER